MAGQIRMTPEDMRSRASDVDGQRQAFGDVVTRMDGVLNQLEAEWDGAASRKFREQFEELKRTSFQNMTRLLEDLGTQLRQTAQAVEDLDNEIASKLGVK
ncbi:MAG: WXG100 family type VII secretion target [Oscillospiraceae bacterium]|jgi:WXG100 family type VII secretion target|nr:WXG100 family type VII secretion target [Oscillospiraceae bacterium]